MSGSIKSFLKYISLQELDYWDVKRYAITDINSKYKLIQLSNLIEERSEKIKLFDEPEKLFYILGVNNKIGLYDAYTQHGNEINQAYKKVYDGDLAYNPYRINVGSIGLKTTQLKNNFISPAYVVFSSCEKLNPNYLYRIFKTDTFSRIINDNTTGSVRQNLKFNTLSNIKIPLPSLKEQYELLEKYDTKISLAEEQEKEAKEIEESIEDFFNNEIGLVKKELKSKTKNLLKKINYTDVEKWGVDKLNTNQNIIYIKNFTQKNIQSIATVSSGGTPSKSNKEYYTGKIPWIKTGEVVNDIILDTKEKITEEAIRNSSAKVYPKGSLIVAMYGQGLTRGRTAKLGVDASTNQACAVLSNIDNEVINTDYLWFYLMNEYHRLRELASGNNQPNLNAEMVKNYKVVIPPLEIQEKIVKEVTRRKEEVKKLKKEAIQNRENAIKEFEEEIFTV